MEQNSESSNTSNQKREGRYFTGEKLAKVLAALTNQNLNFTRVIDPMAGIGDMLMAIGKNANDSMSIAGIEIDGESQKRCVANLESLGVKSHVINANAFNPSIWGEIGTNWDLVITNPPYVRYQSLSTAHGTNPSGEEVRSGLIEILNNAAFENDNVRQDFLKVARTYSGLSDLAVPCWILCMSICNIQGEIALILPSTWLSREYASPVLYLLRRYFKLEIIVEDPDVIWFPGTQVRTTALVATRVADKGSATLASSHKVVSLPKKVGNDRSLVGLAFPTSSDPELDFSTWLQNCDSDTELEGIQVRISDEADLIHKIAKFKDKGRRDINISVPEKLQAVFYSTSIPLTSLGELGWNVGQGMRTGANEFFYVSDAGIAAAYKSKISNDRNFSLPADALRPALIRQHELPSGYMPDYKDASSYLLYLRSWDYPSEIPSPDETQPIEGDLKELIEIGENFSYLKLGKNVRIPELSAVRTNVRKSSSGEETSKWFQLPNLRERHTPDLFLPRIVGTEIKTYINCNPKLVIDANFNSLWGSKEGSTSKFAILALMNSDWTRAWLESVCTSMGGGALKIEAINLKTLCFPKSVLQSLPFLESLGKELLQSSISQQEFQLGVSKAMNMHQYTVSLSNLQRRMSLGRNSS